jgi:ATP-dependent exoDNAse (exonuclease V) beta subunit
MICQSLEIDKDELYGQNLDYCISLVDTQSEEISKKEIEYISHTFKPIVFESNTPVSSTADNEAMSSDNTAANLGITTHKIIELYWDSFRDNQEAILDKMMIFEPIQRKSIIENMGTFYKSDVYQLLKNGVQHKFELEFNANNKTGFIDFIYHDKNRDGWVVVDFKTGIETKEKNEKYQEQLNFYQSVMEDLEHKVVEAKLLWLG